jgi:hypothetical protein
MEPSKSALTRRQALKLMSAAAGVWFYPAFAAELNGIAPQPYFAGVNRALEMLASLGAPISTRDARQIAVLSQANDGVSVEAAEKILDRYSLARLSLSGDGSAQVGVGGAKRVLVEQGWRIFLIRVENPAGKSVDINFSRGLSSPTPGHMMPGAYFSLAQRAHLMDTVQKAPLIEKMWLFSQLQGTTGLSFHGVDVPIIALSGFPIEYQVIQLFSRDPGQHNGSLTLSRFARGSALFLGSTSQTFDFECLPTRDIPLTIHDEDGQGCMASLTIKDPQGLVYPPEAMRLAPDMFFQEHIYRADGETIRLPDGEYTIESKRGPEYLVGTQTVSIGSSSDRIGVNLKRWIDPAQYGWYSGDTHIHAGGCLHYQDPTEGVSPETMIRHVRGEGLYIGDVLSWGPSWYYQKQFFSGHTESPSATLEHPELQEANNSRWQPRSTPKDNQSLLRYDVEVSGFPSSLSGHLVLLRLKKQDYPGTKLIEDWPSWNLPILQWAKQQGAVVGYAHCGVGMVVESTELPNYEIPPFDSIGTNEALVDVTHGVVDFLSGCDTMPRAELNAWYHMLNCGFRLAMLGETDYPCVSGERPGVGRSYVRLDQAPIGDTGYEAWIRSLQRGHLYCGDGRSHLLDFKVEGHRSGEDDLDLQMSGEIAIEATVAARLDPKPPADIETIRYAPVNGWHLENARIGNTREVAVELLMNGVVVDKRTIVADGTIRQIRFKTTVTRSSWLALRIMPSSHTHPVFIRVENKPLRTSKRSALWCRTSIDKLWTVKSPFMRESERPAASEAFDHARQAYDAIASECDEN